MRVELLNENYTIINIMLHANLGTLYRNVFFLFLNFRVYKMKMKYF